MPSIVDVERLVEKISGRVGTLILIRIGKPLKLKPSLAYIELHLVDHCNLNCRGCSHFSPIAEKWFLNPHKYARDLDQLKKLFSTIRKIRLMGGEPLLHPDLKRILYQTRIAFPKADIRIATNGILLDKMPDSFWEACRTTSTCIDLTVYKPLKHKLKLLNDLARAKRVKLTVIKEGDYFVPFYDCQGKSDLKPVHQKCSLWYDCFNLRDGRIYNCPLPTYVSYFNKRFGTTIPADGYVDIFSPNLTGWDVKKVLRKFPSTCRYCTGRWDKIPKLSWAPSKQIITEWDASPASSRN